MARKANTVEVEITAKDTASPVVEKASSSFASFGAAIRGAGFAGALAVGGAAIKALADAFGKAVQAAAESQDAFVRLRAVLGPVGAGSQAVAEALAKQASALQNVSRYDDDAIVAAQALIANYTKEEAQIKALTQVTVDFASAKGVDLAGAASLLGKTFAGTANALGRYGIEVEGAAGSSERLASIVAATNEQFGGAAIRALDSYKAAMQQLTNATGEVEEAIGATVTGSAEYVRQISLQAQATNLLANEMDGLSGIFGPLLSHISNFKTQILAGAAGLIEYATRGNEAAGAAKELAAEQRAATQSTAELKAEQEKLAKSLEDTANAYDVAVDSASAFGVTTSIQLTAKLFEQEQALLDQRSILGANSAEYQALEKIATASMDVLSARIESLRDGHGDLNKEVRETTTQFGSGAEAADAYGQAVLTSQQRVNGATTSLAAYRSELQRTAQQAQFTSREFDALAASAGRAAAVQAGLAGGGSLTLGGTRINLPGGGSRLTTAPGQTRQPGKFTGFNISGGTFTTYTNSN